MSGASAATQDFQWSYCKSPIDFNAYGTGMAEDYSVAMTFNQPSYAGMKITKIDAYLNADAKMAADFSNTSVFIATALTSENTANIRFKEVAPQETTLEGEVVSVLSYELEEPLELTGTPLYIGYNLTVADIPATNNTGQKRPVLTDRNIYEEGTCWVRTPYLTEGLWEINGYTYGAAVIYVTIAREVYEWGLGASFADDVYAEVGKDFDALLTVANTGNHPVNTITYEYAVNGGELTSNTVTLEGTLPPSIDNRYGVLLPIKAVETVGEYELTVNITELNGQPNEAGEAAYATGALLVCPYLPQHRPLVEEYTALNCGYCPRGYVAMEYIRDEYPDEMVGLCYHLEFSGVKEPMAVTGTAPVATTEYPTASIDRMAVIDPYYGDWEVYGTRNLGIVEDVFRRASDVAVADISIKDVEVSVPDSVINFKTDVTFMKSVDSNQYRVGYVLSCDGLYSKEWSQTNYFSRDQQYSNTPLIDSFVSKPQKVYGLVFNNVVIDAKAMRGISETLSDVKPFEPVTLEYSFDVKNVQNIYRESLNPYLEIHRMWVNAFVINRTNGVIVNAVRFPVRDIYSAVGNVSAEEEAVAVEYFDLQGRRVVAPEGGVYVKRSTFAGGEVKTEKVVR